MEQATLTQPTETPESTPLPGPTSDRDIQCANLARSGCPGDRLRRDGKRNRAKYRLEVEQETVRNDRLVKEIARKFGNVCASRRSSDQQAVAGVEAKFNATVRQH